MENLINVINLDTNQKTDKYANPQLKQHILRNREERALSIVRQGKLHGFSIRFWEGDVTDEVFPCRNISRSFKRIVAFAKENRLPFTTIAEDDLFFTSKKSWAYYLEHFPKDFDTYLGGIYAGRITDGRITDGYSGHTLITVHERFYDFFLSADESKHLDRWLGGFCKEKIYRVCTPFVCRQLGGYSESHKRIQDYSMYEKDFTYLR